MRKNLKLLIALAFIIAALATVSFAKEKITIPTFNVEVNGYRVDSSYRQYPLIVYNEITYFPMTYTDARFLGIETDWNASTSTLTIDKTGTGGAYSEHKSVYRNAAVDYAEKCSFNIIVNGNRIYNSCEEYPLLMYRNVTYFPMTWRFAVDEFGWDYSFDGKFGLRIRNDGKKLESVSVNIQYTNEELRPAFYQGMCKDISKPIYVLINYVEDDESKWSQEEIDKFFYTLCDADAFFDKEFAKYGKTFDVVYGHYGVDKPLKYDGIIKKNENGNNGNIDIFEKTAIALGYNSGEHMRTKMLEYAGRDQVIYIYAVNKPGRSYAMYDNNNDGYDTWEAAVIFTKYWDKGDDLLAATVAHEILHLFGADDYYDPFGKYPNRKKYVDTHLSNDIMNTINTDININFISDITAFSVGLTDYIPETIMSGAWWS